MKNCLAYDYSCLMASLPDEMVEGLRQFGLSVPDEYIFQDESGEKGREGKFHVTIKYGIHTKDPEEVREAIAPLLNPLVAKLGKATVFNGDDHVVLKISVQSEDLTRMNQRVRQNLECTDTYPDYKPHITIAYLKKDLKNPYYFQDFCTDEFDGIEVVFDKLVFSTPSGNKYSMNLGESGMNKTAVARELVLIAKELQAIEFPTQNAYDKYMKEHPDADKSLHKVREKRKYHKTTPGTLDEVRGARERWKKQREELHKKHPAARNVDDDVARELMTLQIHSATALHEGDEGRMDRAKRLIDSLRAKGLGSLAKEVASRAWKDQAKFKNNKGDDSKNPWGENQA